jgi:HSP20 family protein
MNRLAKRAERDSVFPSLWNEYFGQNFFDDFFDTELPAINVKESKKKFKLEISLPGFDKDQIELKVDGNMLIISAQKETQTEDKDDENEKFLRQEFSSESFYRSITLPENVDTSNIEASQKAGILTVTLPKLNKAVEDKKKVIAIK